jgi:hypothetical protein
VNLQALAGLLCWLAPLTVRAEWDTYQGDDDHSGYAPQTLALHQSAGITLAWQKTISGGGSLTYMSVGGGNVYVSQFNFGPETGSLYALNTQSGATSWSDPSSVSYTTNTPTYSNGVVYWQTCHNETDNYLFSANAASGAKLTQTVYSTNEQAFPLAPVVYGNSVYFAGNYYPGLYSYTSGVQNWFTGLLSSDSWSPAVNNDYCYAYTANNSHVPPFGNLSIINRSTGSVAYSINDPGYVFEPYGPVYHAPLLGPNDDAFVVQGDRLVKFTVPETSADTVTPGIAWTLAGLYSGAPALNDGVLYVDNGTELDALSESTGNLLWKWQSTIGTLSSNVIVTDDDVFVTSAGGTAIIDLASESAIWTDQIGGNLALSDDMLFIDGGSDVTAISLPEPSPSIALLCGSSLLLRARRRIQNHLAA